VLGPLLDGIPESAAIGVSVIGGGGGVGVAAVAAVFLSNIPEGLSASSGMKASGRSRRTSSASGAPSPPRPPPRPRSGTSRRSPRILTMLSDTMVPEAVKHAGSLVGLVTVLGFVLAFLLSNA
jgi:ZIP family zinc transporter